MKALLLLISLCALLAGCHKSKHANELIGQWKLVETSVAGQQWIQVGPANQATLTFKSDNSFTITPPPVSSASGCSGTYRMFQVNSVLFVSNCYPGVTELLFEFTRDGNTLILDDVASSVGQKSKYVLQ